MKETQMTKSKAPFLTSMLFAVVGPIFFVMAAAFITIPYNLGGYPGDSRLASQTASPFHLT
jgi:hypothetical protein